MPRHPQDPAARFWSSVDKNGPIPAHRPDLGPCWIWQKKISRNGYGSFKVALAHCAALQQRSRHALAHRIALILDGGSIPNGYQVDHLCRNPACVNPRHLEAVTPLINTRRAQKTQCKHGHEFTPANTIIRRRDGYVSRECRTCNYRQGREYRQRQREVA